MRAWTSIAATLLCTNLAFLIWAVGAGQRLTAPLPAVPPPVTTTHLAMTLAGMPGYAGASACDDLARFIAALNSALLEVSEPDLPIPAPVADGLAQTSCRLDDAAVTARLLPYRRLFRAHDLTPPPAFSHFATAEERGPAHPGY